MRNGVVESLLALIAVTCFIPMLSVATMSQDVDQDPLAVPPATREIDIDGNYTKYEWDLALWIPLEFQVIPAVTDDPQVMTHAMVTCSDTHLFIAFRALDPEPESIRAENTAGDGNHPDDWVGVVIDANNDETTCFQLSVNPRGVKTDAVMNDQEGTFEKSWDGDWQCAGKIDSVGYAVEIAIPFSTLEIDPAAGPQTIGMEAIRMYPRGERRLFSNLKRTEEKGYLEQLVKLRLFTDSQ